MSARDDAILALIKNGDLLGAEAALVDAIAQQPEDRELAARLGDVRLLITNKAKAEARPAPPRTATPAAPAGAPLPRPIVHTAPPEPSPSRSWVQTGVVVIAILTAGYWVAHRPSPPPPAPEPAPALPPPVALVPPAGTSIELGRPPPPPIRNEPSAPREAPKLAPPAQAIVADNSAANASPPPAPVDASTVVRCANNGAPGCLVEVAFRSGRVYLQVDTGADITMVTLEGARRAGLSWDKSNPLLTMQGVAGRTSAVLVRASLAVGAAKEEDVLVAVAPVNLGRSDGLLGMTFFERYKSSIGRGELRLLPIDANETPRPGGHGRSWWSLRFRGNQSRLEGLERMVGLAKDADRQIASQFGVDPDGDTLELRYERYRAFAQSEREDLMTLAARSSVPLEWRR